MFKELESSKWKAAWHQRAWGKYCVTDKPRVDTELKLGSSVYGEVLLCRGLEHRTFEKGQRLMRSGDEEDV